jgi:predicted metal-binding membrane protein
MTGGAAREALLSRPRVIVMAALVLLTLLALTYVLWLRAGMMAPSPDMPSMTVTQMAAMMSPGFAEWSAGHFFFIFAMWTVMMVGMMLPTITPMLLLYTRLAEKSLSSGLAFAATAWFAAGYLLAWTGFSLLATLAQYGLERLALLTPMMQSANRPFAAALLVAAGSYQWVPLKNVCLSQCRAPLSFIQRHGGFRPGRLQAVRLGLLHGAYCVGCCWVLMTLLFAGGVMNIFWIVGLMIFMLAEKIAPGGRVLSKVAGVVMIMGGIWYFAGTPHSYGPGRLFQDNAPLRRKSRQPRAQAMIGATAQPVHETGNLAEVEAADHGLDGANLARLHGQGSEAQAQKRHGVQRAPRHLAAERKITAVFRRALNDQADEGE